MVAGDGYKSLDRRGGDGNRSSHNRWISGWSATCADGVKRDEV